MSRHDDDYSEEMEGIWITLYMLIWFAAGCLGLVWLLRMVGC